MVRTIGIFKDIFLLILLYFWNCHFILKTNHFSIENQLVFASIIFLLKINTEFSIELPVHFQPALLYWKLIQFFLLKINSFFSASFFSWKSVQIFLLNVLFISHFCFRFPFFFSLCFFFFVIVRYRRSFQSKKLTRPLT